MNLKQLLDDKVTAAMTAAGIADANAVVKQAQRIEFGHYQANGIMAAAKKQKTYPRVLAE